MRILIFVLLLSCASKPTLYPNEKLKSVGKKTAQSDVEACMKDAEDYLESSKGKQIAKGAGGGAAIGAAVGTVGGMFFGGLGRGLVRGAAIGAAAGGTSAALSPDQIKRNYVNQCLGDKGYRVIGWD